MFGTTEIPDWVFEEAGERFKFTSQVTPEILHTLWEQSPIRYIDQVDTPLMLMIGKDDQRVPTKQARLYYRGLKARNKDVRFIAYEDNSHPIIAVPAESDAFVNIMLWFSKYLD